MNWFWRAVIACAGGMLAVLLFWDCDRHYLPSDIFHHVSDIPTDGANALYTAFYLLPFFLIVVAIYTLLLLRSRKSATDNETRCRKCGYILRGISEPRCPECGETI